MIYIQIPQGMEYQVATEKKPDRLVGLTEPYEEIDIQKTVKEFYHSHRQCTDKETDRLMMSKKFRPDFLQGDYLEYRAVRNGIMPTDHGKVIGQEKKNESSRVDPLQYVGTRWHRHTLLSAERRVAVEAEDEEQKLNRRKWGPNPNAN